MPESDEFQAGTSSPTPPRAPPGRLGDSQQSFITILVYIAEFERITGSQRSMLHAIRHMQSDHFRFLVAFPGQGRTVEYFSQCGVAVTVLLAPEQLFLFGGDFSRKTRTAQVCDVLRYGLPYGARLWWFIRRTRVDIVHCNSHRSLLVAGPSARLAGARVIWHLRSRLFPNRILRLAGELLAHRIVSVSPTIIDELSPRTRRRVNTIPNAVDASAFSYSQPPSAPSVRRNGAGTMATRAGRPPRVGMLTTVVPRKGIHHAVRAMQILRDQYLSSSEPYLLLAGDSPDPAYRRYIDDLIEECTLHRVEFLGFLDDPASLYEQVDIILLSSIESERIHYPDRSIEVKGTEGLPRTILEAMYLQVPVVASEVAGVVDQIVNEESGLLVAPGDVDATAAAIARLLSDGALRDRVTANAFARVQRDFSTEQMVDKLASVYSSVTARPRPPSTNR